MLGISRGPISRIFVAHTITEGALYSSVVSANAACVAVVTSNPSRRNASPSLFENSTLLSINRIFAGFPDTIMSLPPGFRLPPRLRDRLQPAPTHQNSPLHSPPHHSNPTPPPPPMPILPHPP